MRWRSDLCQWENHRFCSWISFMELAIRQNRWRREHKDISSFARNTSGHVKTSKIFIMGTRLMVVHIDRPAPRHFDFLVHTGLLSWSVFAQLIGVCIFVLCMGRRSSCAMTPWYSLPLESLDIIESFWSALQNCAMPRRWCEAWTALILEASVQIKNVQKTLFTPFCSALTVFPLPFMSTPIFCHCGLDPSCTQKKGHFMLRNFLQFQPSSDLKTATLSGFFKLFIVSSFRVSESECFTSTSECGSHRLPQIAKTRLEKIWELRCSCVIMHPWLSTLGSFFHI